MAVERLNQLILVEETTQKWIAEQKENLAAGKKVTVDGMTGKDEKKFSAALQIDAASRRIGFSDFKQEKQGQSETAKQEKSEGKRQGAKQSVS